MPEQLVIPEETFSSTGPITEFRDALHRATPVVFVTQVLVAINVVVFLVMLVRGVPFLQPTAHDLVPWGANFGPLTASGQWWRLLAACFLHFGIVHIAVNMYVLLQVGTFTEALFGNLRYALLYLIAGIGGNIAGLFFHPFAVGAGASGAIFGIFGGLLGFLLVERSAVPRKNARAIALSAGVFIAYNLIYGLVRPETDQVAHIGGILTGFVVGCALAAPLRPAAEHVRPLRAGLVALVSAAIAVFAVRHLPKRDPEQVAWYTNIVESPVISVGRNDRVAYRGRATRADAERIAEALRKDGLFQPADVVVLLDRQTGGATLSIPLRPNAAGKADSWNDPSVINSFRVMGPVLATAAGGPPLRIKLLTQEGIQKNEIQVGTGEVTIGERDRILYSGGIAAAQAAALGVALEQTGFFHNQGATVLASRHDEKSPPELIFLVAANAPHDPRLLDGIAALCRRVAPAVGGLPVMVRLLDSAGESRGEQLVQ